MRTWITETYSDDAKFVQAKGSRREPNFGEVEIRVKATSLNPVDNKLLRHATPWNPELPGILHCDVSGVVTAIGEGVKNFKVGEDVYGCAGGIGQGAFGGDGSASWRRVGRRSGDPAGQGGGGMSLRHGDICRSGRLRHIGARMQRTRLRPRHSPVVCVPVR